MLTPFYTTRGIGNLHGDLPSPWDIPSIRAIPTGYNRALDLCEFMWNYDLTARAALTQVLAYHITDIDVKAVSSSVELPTEQKEATKDLIKRKLDALTFLSVLLRDMLVYGNGYCSLVIPTRRLLSCKRCGSEYSLKTVINDRTYEFNYDYLRVRFNGRCPRCSYKGEMQVRDVQESVYDKALLIRWNPRDISIRTDIYTGYSRYIWRIPADYKKNVRQGHDLTLETASMAVLEAIASGANFEFGEDVIYHAKEPTLGGMRTYGYGLSRLMSVYPAAWYAACLRRTNEAIGSDYIAPLRILSPRANSSGSKFGTDIVQNVNLQGWASNLQQMWAQHRIDPTEVCISGFPVEYTLCGGEAKQLVPLDLLREAEDHQLNGMNVPVDLYRGTLQLQAAPLSLRLFESIWRSLPMACDHFLAWLVKQLIVLCSWQPVRATMRRPSIVDNYEFQLMRAQMASSGLISQTTALDNMDLDWRDEQRAIREEASFAMELDKEQQEQLQSEAEGDQIRIAQVPPSAAGAPPDGGGGGAADQAATQMAQAGMIPDARQPQNSNETETQARAIAQQLLTVPYRVRRGELKTISDQNPTLHAAVIKQMNMIRRQADSEGGMAIMQQSGMQP